MGLGINYDDWKLATPEEGRLEVESCTYCGDVHYYPEEDGTTGEDGCFYCNEGCEESQKILEEENNQNKK